jgi:hypothetical protein
MSLVLEVAAAKGGLYRRGLLSDNIEGIRRI